MRPEGIRIVETFPRSVREIENLWIPIADGSRLAARVWLPADAEDDPVPAILESIPYRKRDLTRRRDEPMHRYFAGNGYAAVRLDLRGAGDSDGVLTDEYTEQEHDDILEVIAWIAAQRWCTGKIGLMGISWGGFNSLQIAARQPPAVKAVISLCAADDRYADDAHYMGGCLLNENSQWGSALMNFAAYPPDPEIVGSRWRRMWLERLEGATLFPATWLRHQRRDDYWRHGSVCEDFARIRCPVYVIGGWADGYSNAVPRILAGLGGPRKGLVGPWSHAYPHDSIPGPSIGFLQEALRWWDLWLKGIDTGIMDEPMYRVWLQESVVPKSTYETRPGRWVAEEKWPSPRIEGRRYAVNASTLDEEAAPGESISFCSPQTTGLGSGDWCAFGAEGEMPADQRRDDGASMTFDSARLAERVEILGSPSVELELSVDRPLGFVVARLNDVAPDGSSLRVSYGALNLTHRPGSDRPEAVDPHKRYRVRLDLNHAGHAFPAGHRVRLALSTSYWPVIWPSAEAVTLTVFPGSGWLELPVRPAREEDARLLPFEPPEQAPQTEHVQLRPGRCQRTVTRDLATSEIVLTVFTDEAELEGALARITAIDLELAAALRRCHRIGERDPLSACTELEQRTLFRRGAWSVGLETRMTMTATRDAFLVRARLEAFEGDRVIYSREWDERVVRDYV